MQVHKKVEFHISLECQPMSIFVHSELLASGSSLDKAILQMFPWSKVDHRLTFQKDKEFTFLVSNDLNFTPHSGAKNPKIE